MNLAGSGLNDLRIALRTAQAEGAILPEDAEAASAEITAALAGGESDAPSNVILIVVESWGSGVDPELDALVLEPLARAVSQIPGARLRQGRVPFAGSTVPGEIRELCGRKVLTTRPRLEAIADDCLPRLLKRHGGYTTLAVHGFAPAMFSRNAWYPELGFDTIAFAPELTKAGARERCGVAFPGICDREAWHWIASEIRAPGRHFVYWLTLSGHLPLPRSPAWRAPEESRCRTINVADGVCDLLLVHRALFEALAESAIGGDLADTLIVAVGDHSPPFLQASNRALFESGHVPFVSLRLPTE